MLSLILLTTLLAGSATAAEDRSARDRLNQLTDQQSQLRRQILDKQKQAAAAKKQVQQLANDVSRLERDIQTTERKIDDTAAAISDTQADIQTKADEIQTAEATLATQKGYQSEAIRVLYETGEDDPVKLMLASTKLSDLIDAAEYLTSLEERIALIIDQVTETKHGLEDRRHELEQQEAELARLKAQQEAYKVGLATQQQQKVILKADAKAKQTSLEQQVQEAKELVGSVELEMARLRSALTKKGGPGTIQARDRGTSAVGFQWPTDFSYTSTYFGGSTPFQPNGGHGGLDLVNISGTPIYAAADGTVTAVADMMTNGHFYAYGRYIVIGHNARFSSLYAHLQSVAVSPGDEVKRGDVIGYMGTTGWSTGPHLHFEIWESDRRTDPLLYLP